MLKLTHGQRDIAQRICIVRIAMIYKAYHGFQIDACDWMTNQRTIFENQPRFYTKHSFAHLPFHHSDLTIPAVDTSYLSLFALKLKL